MPVSLLTLVDSPGGAWGSSGALLDRVIVLLAVAAGPLTAVVVVVGGGPVAVAVVITGLQTGGAQIHGGGAAGG